MDQASENATQGGSELMELAQPRMNHRFSWASVEINRGAAAKTPMKLVKLRLNAGLAESYYPSWNSLHIVR